MAAIVRIKRRRCEDSVESLLISCKKRKENEMDTSGMSGVLKFAGTVPIEETNVSHYIREAIKKDKLQKDYKMHFNSDSESRSKQHRKLQRQQAESNRYKVVASRRAPLLDHLDDGATTTASTTTTTTSSASKNNEDKENGHGCTKVENNGFVVADSNASSRASVDGKSSKSRMKVKNDNVSESVGHGDVSQASNNVLMNLAGEQKVFCLYDVEHESEEATNRESEPNPPSSSSSSSAYSNITCNGVPLTRETVATSTPVTTPDEDYVYDLYYSNSQELDFRMLQDVLTVQAFGQEPEFADSRGDEDELVEAYDDEDDSNDEGNWRNDYPDEENSYRFHRNASHEYGCGDDDIGLNRFDTDDSLATYLSTSCNVRDTELNPGDTELNPDAPVPAGRSYESYYRSMLQDLADDTDTSKDSNDTDDGYDIR